jgi:glycosyltransferase involved in cell wall biosynthesis
VRARLVEPMLRLGIDHHLHAYFPSAVTVRSGLRGEPVSVLRSERNLRGLVDLGSRTLFLNREASPFSRGTVEADLLRTATRGVLDLDDALHLDVRSDVASRMFPKPVKIERAARAADVVIAGNPFLADWATAFARDVRIIPTCVDVSRYRRKRSYELSDPPRLVWLGTRSGEPYLADIAPSLKEAHRRTGARLTIIGDPTAPMPTGLDGMLDRLAWRPGLAEGSLADYDVGLMPLRDTFYERGKCAYKLLEYGAAGLPALASPVGANGQILEASGLTAPSTSDEWIDALIEILEATAAERAQRGQALRQVVEERFDYAAWLPRWRELIDEADKIRCPT